MYWLRSSTRIHDSVYCWSGATLSGRSKKYLLSRNLPCFVRVSKTCLSYTGLQTGQQPSTSFLHSSIAWSELYRMNDPSFMHVPQLCLSPSPYSYQISWKTDFLDRISPKFVEQSVMKPGPVYSWTQSAYTKQRRFQMGKMESCEESRVSLQNNLTLTPKCYRSVTTNFIIHHIMTELNPFKSYECNRYPTTQTLWCVQSVPDCDCQFYVSWETLQQCRSCKSDIRDILLDTTVIYVMWSGLVS